MVALLHPNPKDEGFMVRFVDYPFAWLMKRATPRGAIGDLFAELRCQWHERACPYDEQLDQQWVSICLDAIRELNSPKYGDLPDSIGVAVWEFVPATTSNDVGAFIYYDYGVAVSDD